MTDVPASARPASGGGASGLGGRTTVAAGIAFVVLQLLTIFAIGVGVARMQQGAARATELDTVSADLDRLHRAVQDVVITDSSNSSRVMVRDSLARLEQSHARGVLTAAIAGTQTSWPKLVETARGFETDRSMSVGNIKALIALGKFSSVTQKLGERLEVDAAAARLSAAHTERITFYVIVAAGVLNAVGTGLIYLLFFRRVTRPLRHATDAAARMACGDFTGAISGRGGEATALLRALGAMQSQVGGLLAEIRLAAEAVLGGAGDLAHGNRELSSRTEQQASTLEETASSMEELTSTVQQNAAGARKADQLASGTSEVAAKAGRVVGDMVKTMQNIAGSSRRISEITGLIDGIAFQTNILALNAAVEAARAGDQGRGFAVVAAEVRSLAQRSAAAAKEIKQLIEASAREVNDGGRLVREAGDTMQEVVVSVGQVTELVGAIARASSEQSDGIQQVTSAVTQMDTVVQQNAALVEQASGATDMMRAQAEALLQMVTQFQLADAAPQPLPAHPVAPSPSWLAMPAPA